MLRRPVFFAAMLACVPIVSARAQPATSPATAPATAPAQTWTHTGPGEWTRVSEAAPATQSAANETLDRVDRLLASRRHEAARKIVLSWLKKYPHAPDRDRGLFLLAEAYYQYGDRIRAFYHLDELLDFFPESRLFYPALEKQYQIADAFLRGYKRRLFGFHLLGGQEEAIDMLFRIQERAPASPLAERALLRTADYYYDRGHYDLAADAYTHYTRGFPRSPVVPRARLRAAYATLAQFRGRYYDATPLVDARAQLDAIRVAYPDLARDENLDSVIRRIDATMAGKLYWTANFYRRTHEPRAAVYTYRYLIDRYPGAPESAAARRRLDQMPRWALADPPPAPATDDAPPAPAEAPAP